MTPEFGAFTLDLLKQVEAVAVGQIDIEQHEVEQAVFNTPQAFFAGRGGIRLVSFELKELLETFANFGFVVDDEDGAFS